MLDIPPILQESLILALEKCDDVFSEQVDLRHVFDNPGLMPWKSRLLEASSLRQRIERTIGYLKDKVNSQKQNILPLFLVELAKRYNVGDERPELLQSLADQLQSLGSLTQQLHNDNKLFREANPLNLPMTQIADLEDQRAELDRILKCARAVCYIEVPRYRKEIHEGSEQGTGWLLAPGLVITCWHVVAALCDREPQPEDADVNRQVEEMVLHFDFTREGKGLEHRVADLLYRPTDPQEQDFALLRIQEREEFPFSKLGYLPIACEPKLGSRPTLPIIQHPLGRVKQLAFGKFIDGTTESKRIQYDTPTERGTSGSPVLRRPEWQVVALHNGENQAKQLREGTTIKAILDELQRCIPDIYQDILQAQRVLTKPLSRLDEAAQSPTKNAHEITLPPLDRLHHGEQAQQARRPVSWLPPQGDNIFRERNEEFTRVLDELHNDAGRVPCIAFIGMGGIGKTRFAYEIAKKMHDEGDFPGGVYWIVPENANRLPLLSDDQAKRHAWEADFADLAAKTNYLPEKDNEHSSENEALRARHICDYLARSEDALVVFDNVEDPQYAIKAIATVVGKPMSRCAILYTSQCHIKPSSTGEREVHWHQVERLSDGSACKLLLEKRTDLLEIIEANEIGVEAKAAHTILKITESLPLTLFLLANILGEDDFRYSSLLPLVSELEALGQVEIFEPEEHAKRMLGHVLTLRWERIKNEETKHLLQLISYYPAYTAIPLPLLSIAMGKREENPLDTRAFHQAKTDLKKWSLVEILSPDALRLHSLIGELTRKIVEASADRGKALRSAAAANLLFAFTSLNRLTRCAEQLGYWQCLDWVKAASQYAQFLDSETSKPLEQVATWLQYENNILGNMQLWPDRLPGLFYQQLYNHFVEEHVPIEREDEPARWVRLEKRVGGQRFSSLWHISCDALIRRPVLSERDTLMALALHDLAKGERSILIYDLKNGQLKNPIRDNGLDKIMDIIFTSKDSQIVVVDSSGWVTTWKTESGERCSFHKLTLEEGTFTCMALAPDGSTCAVGTRSGVCLYEAEDTEGWYLPGCDDAIKSLVLSRDGAWVVAGTAEDIYLWDIQHKVLLDCISHKQAITCVAISPDKKRLAVGRQDGRVIIQSTSGEPLKTLADQPGDPVTCLAFSNDNTKLSVGTEGKWVQIWAIDLTTGEAALFTEFADRNGYIMNMAFTGDGAHLITTARCGETQAWDIAQITQISSKQGDPSEYLVFSADGTTASTISENNQVQQWSPETAEKLSTLFGNAASQWERTRCIACSPDGNLIGIGTSLGNIFLGDVRRSANPVRLGRHNGRVTCIAFSPCGNFLATGSKDGVVLLYDIAGQKESVLQNHNGLVSCLAFSSDSTFLITGTPEGTFSLWERATGQCLYPPLHQNLLIKRLYISPDGATLVASTLDGAIYTWPFEDLANAHPLELARPTSSEITALSFSPGGNFLLACYGNHQADFIYLGNSPAPGTPPLGKFPTTGYIGAIHWKDSRHLILAELDETNSCPGFYHLTLEGNWPI